MNYNRLINTLRMAVFLDVVLCSLVDTDQRFKGAYCLHLQGDESLMMKAVNSSETSVNIRLHGATSQKIAFFKFGFART
jgi:hypothetical protein